MDRSTGNVIAVHLACPTAVKGIRLPVKLSSSVIAKYRNVQLEIFDVGVTSPSSQLGFGAQPNIIGEAQAVTEIDTGFLQAGLYEIKLVRLHGSLDDPESIGPQVDFVGGRDFPRTFFRVVDVGEEIDEAEDLSNVARSKELAAEAKFLAPVDVRSDATAESYEYFVLVFVRDLLIGTPMRFENFEIVPTGAGLDSRDEGSFVNSFLANRTTLGLRFEYGDEDSRQAQASTPVCVMHFPVVLASRYEEALEYCVEKTERLLKVLSLTRDAGGKVFEVVVVDRGGRGAQKFSYKDSYKGNLLTGSLSGELVDTVGNYLNRLDGDPLSDFLLSLYKEAARERSHDFRYVRYWQILEVMAEAKNYAASDLLVGVDGLVIKDGDIAQKCSGSINIVFRMLVEAGAYVQGDLWASVNTWFAFRSAAAHQGSVARYNFLGRAKVREWGRRATEELSSLGYDRYLADLQGAVKSVLVKRLLGD